MIAQLLTFGDPPIPATDLQELVAQVASLRPVGLSRSFEVRMAANPDVVVTLTCHDTHAVGHDGTDSCLFDCAYFVDLDDEQWRALYHKMTPFGRVVMCLMSEFV